MHEDHDLSYRDIKPLVEALKSCEKFNHMKTRSQRSIKGDVTFEPVDSF